MKFNSMMNVRNFGPNVKCLLCKDFECKYVKLAKKALNIFLKQNTKVCINLIVT